MGVWGVPFTSLGAGRWAASSTVGVMSMTWWNWLRTSFFALMPFGQWMTMPFRVPPKLEATCLVHMKGESKATAQPAAMWGKVSGLPH